MKCAGAHHGDIEIRRDHNVSGLLLKLVFDFQCACARCQHQSLAARSHVQAAIRADTYLAAASQFERCRGNSRRKF